MRDVRSSSPGSGAVVAVNRDRGGCLQTYVVDDVDVLATGLRAVVANSSVPIRLRADCSPGEYVVQ